jgi:mannitol/fructose-specific phosphotransferase system IIA component (Ntr-type)
MPIRLSDLLTAETVKLDATPGDWAESVRLAGGLLVGIGAVLPSYVVAMIRAVEEIGPYMVLAPGIALAHGRPEDGVQRPCMSLVRLVAPVEFGSRANDPVDLVFAFGATDNETHLEALKELVTLLQDEEAIRELRQCSTREDAVRLIRLHGKSSPG